MGRGFSATVWAVWLVAQLGVGCGSSEASKPVSGQAGSGAAGAAANASATGGAESQAGSSSGAGGELETGPARAGASGSGFAGDGAAGDAGASGQSGAGAVPDLFSDPLVPRCDDNATTQYQLRGDLDGAHLDIHTLSASNLDGHSFQLLEVVAEMVREPLVLSWSDPLRENKALPLNGNSLRVPDDQPLGGQSFCITAGMFGSPALAPGDGGRTLLFRITGARAGDCSGADVSVALSGCVFRTSTYFPMPGSLNFPIDPSRPNVDTATDMRALTLAQKAALCDWSNLELGGYDAVTDCSPIGGSSVQNYRDQAQCVSIGFSQICPGYTVQDYINCTLAEAPTHDCVYPSDQCQLYGCL